MSAQALTNEKILSQQKLEQIIAFNAIYNPRRAVEHKKPTQQSFLTALLQKINNLLHVGTALVASSITTFQNLQTSTQVSSIKIYNIPYTKNPCDKPLLFNDTNIKKFNFCN